MEEPIKIESITDLDLACLVANRIESLMDVERELRKIKKEVSLLKTELNRRKNEVI